MLRVLLLFAFVVLMFNCTRTYLNDVLTGSWRLTQVYDKNTASTILPPPGRTKDVVITFSSGNRFSSHTLRNTFSNGTYTLQNHKITFGPFSMTKVTEDEWGGSFLTVLTACLLQSVAPCIPSTITISGNTMQIQTPLRYNVTLEKL